MRFETKPSPVLNPDGSVKLRVLGQPGDGHGRRELVRRFNEENNERPGTT